MFEDIQRDLVNAQTAQEGHKRALIAFTAAIMAGDWKKADEARVEVLAHQEAYLDHMTAAQKRAKE